ncbi:SDR family NAD(P)-dependent oxidoreductase [Ilumatobacter coccineus]|uniref:Putative oxidoreductase n=1 Tax=Ilumatobacter coccineus (strain NBRC 103263 / KCTC 29153 / YM16-304) TaxID=1313172 RepID=A0A6C7EHX6_ILUCY|nr:SDR family NAD(P)-dependent oxidoreductase [Ilumatobacter coccineus]BAN04565.1 putative oxidoreductase [Ilumatobacter coccineus YM16-304]
MSGRATARTIITTGANSGIGLATVIEAAHRGHRSIGTVRSDEKAEAVHAAADEAGVTVETALLDVTDEAAGVAVVDEYRPDALVNNAGFAITGAIEDVSDDEARFAFETMVLAPMRLARLAVPHMRDREWGRIVNVSSIYGRTTTPLTGWYRGCKHALEGLSDALRMEVARDGIKVVLVEPGGVKTAIWEETEREVERRSGSRFDENYRRSLASTRLWQPIMIESKQCADVIVDTIEGNPRARYRVGLDAQALGLTENLVPTFVRDRIARITFGL